MTMPALAYSYLRFSTPEQAHGDSRRRQLALAESYAAQHGLLLDKGLSFRDLGVSAFRGRNAKQGGLRSFLDAIEYGLVPPSSFLLVESLDRLSRDRILEAQALFLQTVNAGVTIVTLIDQRAYSSESLNANPTDLTISLVYMMRANEESATKSSRLKAAIATRRNDPAIRYHGRQCPAWLKANPVTRTYEVIPDKVEVIRRNFREALAGRGLLTITQGLNRDGVPMFGRGNQRGKIWQRALVRHFLRTPLVLGTYTPCESILVDGKLRYVPTTPKPNYYPAIIDVADFEAMRNRRLAWVEHYGLKSCQRRTSNVLSRLAKCPKCGRPMVMTRSDAENQRYLICMAWREGRACSNEWVRFPEIEDVFLSDVRFLIARCPQPVLNVEARRSMLRAISNRLSNLRARLRDEVAARDQLADQNRTGRTWSRDTQAEIDRLLAERYRLRLERNYWRDATLDHKLEALAQAVAAQPRELALVNERLRALLTKVVVDWERNRLELHWRHGAVSHLGFWRRRQKGTKRNPTMPAPNTWWPQMPEQIS